MSPEQRRVLDRLARLPHRRTGTRRVPLRYLRTYHTLPQSCGNRHCPLCQGHKAKQWLEQQLEKLLPCAYFLITFTLPQELRPFALAHPGECYRAMFDAAAATLRELASNPKYVGSSRLGFTGVLHTWGGSLNYHPHVHFIVPGSAQRGRPTVAAQPRRFLRPGQSGLADLSRQVPGLPGPQRPGRRSPRSGRRQEVGGSQQGRRRRPSSPPLSGAYVYRVAISNGRLVKCEPGPDGLGRVTFTYRKSGSRRLRAMTVTAEEFIRRFLQHVLPRGFQKVRHYGFAHPRQRINFEWLKMLVTVTLNAVYVLLVAAQPLPAPILRPVRLWRGDDLHGFRSRPAGPIRFHRYQLNR